MLGLSSIKEKVLAGSVLVLGIALAGLSFYHWVSVSMLKSELKTANETIGTLTVEKASLEVQRENLSLSLKKQTKAVEDLIQAQESSSKRAAEAIAKAREDAAKWKKQYTDILNAPKPLADDCQAFSIQLDRYIDLRKREAVQ
jgi:chromosome segregation ATPase